MTPTRVLVIDDDPMVLEFLVYAVKSLGFEAIAAAGGAEGIDKAVDEKPDVILCDILMPHPDGYEVQHRLATTPATATIPMLAVTALAMAGDKEKILKAGFQAYISKPIELDDLGRIVRSFAADSKMATEVSKWAM